MRDLLEVTIVFALILLALWSGPFAKKVIGIATFCWIVISTPRSQATADSLGLRLSGARRSLWIVCATLLLAALVIGIASRMHTLHVVLFHGLVVETSVLAYLLWALVQQFILQDFFLVRLLRLLPGRAAAVIVAAALFAVAHLPNSFLMVATLIWGIAACALFLRYRDLYSLGIAHGIMGLCLAIAIPNTVHHQMRVGLRYLQWHEPAGSSQPDRPDCIDRRVGDGGCYQPALFAPRSPVKDSGQGCQQHIAPVEVRRAFVEV